MGPVAQAAASAVGCTAILVVEAVVAAAEVAVEVEISSAALFEMPQGLDYGDVHSVQLSSNTSSSLRPKDFQSERRRVCTIQGPRTVES